MFWQRVQHVPRECAAYQRLKWGQVKSRREPGMNEGVAGDQASQGLEARALGSPMEMF